MTDRFSEDRQRLEGHDLAFFAGLPYVYHCHHFNLFHDQTIDDVLGEEEAFRLKARVARDHFGELLRRLAERHGASTHAEKAELGQELLASMGHGRLPVVLEPAGGARAETGSLHYGFTWREKYGEQVRRFDPVDAVGAGVLAAVAELADGSGRRYEGEEEACLAQRAERCELRTRPAGDQERLPIVDEAAIAARLGAHRPGLDETTIEQWAARLVEAACNLEPDERGLLPVFNVYVTQHLAGYYNETGFAAVRHAEATSPQVAGAAEALLREAGHVCVFNTFGNILLSELWPQVAEPLTGDPGQIVRAGCAIARALNFGSWSVEEHEPGRRLVVRTAANYEAFHWLERFGVSDRSRCYFMQGAVQAFMVLSERVPWKERPTLDQAFYDSLFRGERPIDCKVTVPRCITKGDAETVVVVEPQNR